MNTAPASRMLVGVLLVAALCIGFVGLVGAGFMFKMLGDGSLALRVVALLVANVVAFVCCIWAVWNVGAWSVRKLFAAAASAIVLAVPGTYFLVGLALVFAKNPP